MGISHHNRLRNRTKLRKSCLQSLQYHSTLQSSASWYGTDPLQTSSLSLNHRCCMSWTRCSALHSRSHLQRFARMQIASASGPCMHIMTAETGLDNRGCRFSRKKKVTPSACQLKRMSCMCQQARTSGKKDFVQATMVLCELKALLTALFTLGPSWPTQRTRTFAALHRHS